MADYMSPILIAGFTGCLIGVAISAYCFSVIANRKTVMYKRVLILLKLLKNNLKQLNSDDYRPAGIVENSDVDNAVFALIPYLPVKLRKPFKDLWLSYRFDKFSKNIRLPSEYTDLATDDSKKLIAERINELIKFLNEIIYSV